MREHIDTDVSGLLSREITLPEAGEKLMTISCGRATGA